MASTFHIRESDWQTIESCLTELPSKPAHHYITLESSDDEWFAIYFVESLGFYMSGAASGDLDYYTLIDSQLGHDFVQAFIGGNDDRIPRAAFVSLPILLQAAEYYFKTGKRDTRCEWKIAEMH